MATLAPSRANRTAIACPMPEDAPVIKMFLALRRSMCAPVISVSPASSATPVRIFRGARWNISKVPRDRGSYAHHTTSHSHIRNRGRVAALWRLEGRSHQQGRKRRCHQGLRSGSVLYPEQTGERIVRLHAPMDEFDLVVRERGGP